MRDRGVVVGHARPRLGGRGERDGQLRAGLGGRDRQAVDLHGAGRGPADGLAVEAVLDRPAGRADELDRAEGVGLLTGRDGRDDRGDGRGGGRGRRRVGEGCGVIGASGETVVPGAWTATRSVLVEVSGGWATVVASTLMPATMLARSAGGDSVSVAVAGLPVVWVSVAQDGRPAGESVTLLGDGRRVVGREVDDLGLAGLDGVGRVEAVDVRRRLAGGRDCQRGRRGRRSRPGESVTRSL